jgi:hypothetical protein
MLIGSLNQQANAICGVKQKSRLTLTSLEFLCLLWFPYVLPITALQFTPITWSDPDADVPAHAMIGRLAWFSPLGPGVRNTTDKIADEQPG